VRVNQSVSRPWRAAATPRAAAGVAAATLVITWLGTGLAIVNGTGWRAVWTSFTFGGLAVAVTFTLVGGVVAVRAPHHPVGWLLIAVGVCLALWLFLTQYATYAGPGRVSTAAAWVASWVWSWATLPFALLLLVFPDGRPRWPWTRALAWVVVACTAAGALSLALSASTAADGIPAWYRNPFAVPGVEPAPVSLAQIRRIDRVDVLNRLVHEYRHAA
jgi:hypothetical protein